MAIFFDCLFIDSFCDLCPTRHHKRGASRDHSQQNSSIALLLSPCFRGDERREQRCRGGGYRRGRVGLPLYSTAVFTLNTFVVYSFSSLSLSTFCSQKVAKTFGTSFASRSRLLLVSYYVTSLIRLLLVTRVCRSNLGNKRTRFTRFLHRMAHTLRHFCSFSSIGTDTRCCSTPCRFFWELHLCARMYYPPCFMAIF